MNIGAKIKEIRTKKGMTQKQVADLCGMADSAIRKYESGKQTPKLDTLQKIANALDCDFWELCGAINTIPLQKMNELQDGIDSLHFDTNFPIVKKYFERLNASGQEVALERIKELTEIPRYQRYQKEGEQSAVDPQENE